MMRNKLSLMLVAAALACSPAKRDASKDTLQPIDTLQPATNPLPATDSVAGATTQSKSGATTAVKNKTTAATKTKRDSIIGRDSVTPLDPNKPLLPPAKRP